MADGRPGFRIRVDMLLRAAILGIPALAILVAALFMLGPGRARPAIGAKVWGVPAEGSHHLALRVHVLEHFAGALSHHGDQDIRVELFDTATPPWDGRTDEKGVADARLDSETSLMGEVQIRITNGRRELARERIMLRPIRNRLVPRSPVPGTNEGELQLELTLPRGAMSPPFAERASVVVRDCAGKPAPDVAIEAEGAGVVVTPATMRADVNGRATFELSVHTINPELSVRATAPVRAATVETDPSSTVASGHWQGRLPVVPGAIWLAPVEPAKPITVLRLTSPNPKDLAYVSLLSNRGREQGQVVRLTEQGGFHRGTLELTLPDAEWHAVTVSTDPYEQSAATVTWPLGSLDGKPELQPLDLLIDGMPAAKRLEMARAWSARRSALLVLAAAALLEMALLMLRSRAAGRALEAHIAHVAREPSEGSDGDTAPIVARDLVAQRSSQALTLLFVVLVALAFAVVGALAYVE